MTCKDKTEEIVDFTLIPVGPRPDARHGGDCGMLFSALSHANFQAHIALIFEGEQLIDYIIARHPFEPVNRRNRLQHLVVKIFLEIIAYLYKILRLENNRLLIAIIDRFNDGLRELPPHHIHCRSCFYDHTIIPNTYLSLIYSKIDTNTVTNKGHMAGL